MNQKIDAFLNNATKWRKEMERLRAIALDCGLNEELKWGKPCYTVNHGNVAIIQPFKTQCAFMFFKGVFLNDPEGLLEKPGQNSQAARRVMFSSVDQIVRTEPQVRVFIAEAIKAENAGLKVKKKTRPEPIPDELKEMFGKVSGLKEAFETLTPGRKRAYILHFSNAKQPKTRLSRIEKCVPRILDGNGLND